MKFFIFLSPTEFLVILAVILILVGLVVYRYRKQIQTAWIMFQTFRKFRQQFKPQKKKQVSKKTKSTDSELVRCPKCSKWTSKDEAVKLKSNFYCSLSCMEESISVGSKTK